jgi:hypothetical protein
MGAPLPGKRLQEENHEKTNCRRRAVVPVGGTGSGAQAAPWCALYDASTYNCGFHTFEQCLATVRGGRMVPAEFFRRL